MQAVKKRIISYKYTITYLVLGCLLLGWELAIVAGVSGLLVDYIISRKNACKSEGKGQAISHIWLFLIIPFSIIYGNLIKINTGPHVYGMIYDWIEFTKPLTDKMAEYVPAIDSYTNQILQAGQKWRVDRVRHLYGIMWFVCIMASSLLFGNMKGGYDITVRDFSKLSIPEQKKSLLKIYPCLLIFSILFFYSFYFGFFGGWFISGGDDYYRSPEKYITAEIWGIFLSTYAFIAMSYILLNYKITNPTNQEQING